jgi:hypothetical protein
LEVLDTYLLVLYVRFLAQNTFPLSLTRLIDFMVPGLNAHRPSHHISLYYSGMVWQEDKVVISRQEEGMIEVTLQCIFAIFLLLGCKTSFIYTVTC